jgi:REP element-mobilizing transposase RayT
MARRPRIQQAGLTYHITSRGNGKRDIFLDDEDRRFFLDVLTEVVSEKQLICCAHCLMNNHYHLVVRTLEANLGSAMQALNGNYGQWWNRRHGKIGHVFQGRYHSQVIHDERYFITACRYVVLNPVRAGLVQTPDQWCWSSYCATAGLAPVPAFLSVEPVHRHFHLSVELPAAEMYRKFVATSTDDEEQLRLPRTRNLGAGDPIALSG